MCAHTNNVFVTNYVSIYYEQTYTNCYEYEKKKIRTRNTRNPRKTKRLIQTFFVFQLPFLNQKANVVPLAMVVRVIAHQMPFTPTPQKIAIR
jgi:hypothetical protein